MAKRKAAPKKKPVPLRNAQGRFQGVQGMSPAEVQAWRAQELRERTHEAKARDEALRKAGKKSGRPRGPKRLERDAEREQRRAEVKRQASERHRRKGASKSGYQLPTKGKRGVVEKRKTKRGGIEKRVFRSVGLKSFDDALKELRALPRGTSAWVQVGTGYGPQGTWVGSRLTSPAEAAHWLQGIGMEYRKKIFPGRSRDALWVEVIGYRKVKK